MTDGIDNSIIAASRDGRGDPFEAPGPLEGSAKAQSALREGEVLHIPSWVEHQAEALDDTFELDVFSPIRQDWLDHTDDYFHR